MNQRESCALVKGYRIGESLGTTDRNSETSLFVATLESYGNSDIECQSATVVMKLLRADVIPSRFVGEVHCLQALRDADHVVPLLFEISQEDLDDLPAYQSGYAMPFYRNGTLRELMRNGSNGIAIVDAVCIIVKIGRALAQFHKSGYIHRDVKPENILMMTRQDPMLGDPGIVKEAGEPHGTIATVGSLDYIAPEQIRDSSKVEAPADVFALGCILYELLTGQRPYVQRNMNDRYQAIEKTAVQWASVMRPEVDPMLNRICMTMLRRRPRSRPTAELLASRLEAWLAKRSSLEKQPPLLRRVQHAGFRAADRLFALAENQFLKGMFVMLLAMCPLMLFLLNQSSRYEREVSEQGMALRQSEQEMLRSRSRFQADLRASAEKSRSQLRRILLAPGLEAFNKGDVAAALPHLVVAHRIGEVDTDRHWASKQRLAWALHASPRVIDAWQHNAHIRDLRWSSAQRWLVSISGDNIMKVQDTETRMPVMQEQYGYVQCSLDRHGKICASVTGRGVNVQRMEMVQGNEPRQIAGGRNDLDVVVIDPTATYVATADKSGVVQVWSVDNQSLVSEPGKQRDRVNAIAFSRDGSVLVVGCGGRANDNYGEARMFEAATGKERFPGAMRHGDDVSDVAISDSGTYVVTGGYDGVVKVWQIDEEQAPVLKNTVYHGEPVHEVGFAEGSSLFVSCSAANTAFLGSALTGKIVGLMHPAGPIYSAKFMPGNGRIATACIDGSVRIFNTDTGELAGEVLHHPSAVMALVVTSKDNIVTGDRDGTVRVWDVPEPVTSFTDNRLSGSVEFIDVSSDGAWVLGASGLGQGSRSMFMLLDKDGEQAIRPQVFDRGIQAIDLHPTKPIVSVSVGGKWYVYELNGEELVENMPDPELERVWLIRYSNSGERVVVGAIGLAADPERLGAAATRLRMYDAMGSEQFWERETNVTFSAEFNSNDSSLLVAEPEGFVRVLRSDDGGQLFYSKPFASPVTAIASSSSGRFVAAIAGDAVRVWECPGWDVIAKLNWRQSRVEDVAFSPNEETVATGHADGCLVLWGTKSGKRLAAPVKHFDAVRDITYSSDGRLILTGSGGGNRGKYGAVRLWSSLGEPISEWLEHENDVMQVAFMNDGERIVSGSWDGVLRLWTLPSADYPMEGSVIMDFANLVSCKRVDEAGDSSRLSTKQWWECWGRIRRQVQ